MCHNRIWLLRQLKYWTLTPHFLWLAKKVFAFNIFWLIKKNTLKAQTIINFIKVLAFHEVSKRLLVHLIIVLNLRVDLKVLVILNITGIFKELRRISIDKGTFIILRNFSIRSGLKLKILCALLYVFHIGLVKTFVFKIFLVVQRGAMFSR